MDSGASQPEGAVDWVDLGEIGGGSHEDGPGSRPLRRPGRGLAVVIGVALLGGAAVAVRDNGSPHAGGTTSSPKPSSVAPGPQAATPADLTPAGPAPVVSMFAPHLLGVTTGWQLLGRGGSVVVRLEPAAGRLSRTRVPPIQSTGPVSFLAGDRVTVVRPLDDVPGYAIGDGEAARLLRADLSNGGIALPGPDARHVWFDSGDERRTAMALVDLEGVPAGVRMAIPSTALGPVISDGNGYVMFSGIGGVYDARPKGLDRITTGTVAAVGAGRLLAVECNDQYQCSTVVLGLTDGSRRVIAEGFPPTYAVGSIAPNGRRAAVFEQGQSGVAQLELFDLRTGHTTPVRLSMVQPLDEGAVAWSPDSALLFVLDSAGDVRVVDPSTAGVSDLGVALPALSQIAVRPALPSAG